jgi:hypothetical protein
MYDDSNDSTNHSPTVPQDTSWALLQCTICIYYWPLGEVSDSRSLWMIQRIRYQFLDRSPSDMFGKSRDLPINVGRGYIHGFRGPNARTRLASTDSVHRTPELSRELALRPRIPWTERQKYRCVHGFREQNAAGELSLNSTPHELLGSHSDAMKSRRGTCHVAQVLLIIPPCTIQCFIQGGTAGVPITSLFFSG